jgi:deoxycytidylate deaminase
MNDGFIRSYMKMAKFISSNKISCLSRGIGTVIVHPTENRTLGTGYNGPPRETPRCDDYNYLKNIVFPQLTKQEKDYVIANSDVEIIPDLTGAHKEEDEMFATRHEKCGTCPRRLIGAQSGQRLELCSCAHSEQNAIINAGQSVAGAYLFCWCSPPCFDICAKAIVNANIARVYCLKSADSLYNENKTRWLFATAGVELHELEEEWINAI